MSQSVGSCSNNVNWIDSFMGKNLSIEEQKQVARRELKSIVADISSLNIRATILEQKTTVLSDDTLLEIQNLIDDMKILLNRNYITGGNLTVSETAPVNPQENDIWFDTSLIKATR